MKQFLFVYNNVINVEELLYVKPVKSGKLYICIFKGEEQTLFLIPEEAEDLMKQLKKLNKSRDKKTSDLSQV